MTDFEVEGHWRWNNSGDPLTLFNDWGLDAPENKTSRNCAKFSEGRRRRWTDDECSKTETFTMCEGR